MFKSYDEVVTSFSPDDIQFSLIQILKTGDLFLQNSRLLHEGGGVKRVVVLAQQTHLVNIRGKPLIELL